MKNIFISFPYSSDRTTEDERAQVAIRYAAQLIELGHIPLAPALLGHQILRQEKIDASWETWKKICEEYISLCDEIHVLAIEGWEDSVGVAGEIEFAISTGKTVVYVR